MARRTLMFAERELAIAGVPAVGAEMCYAWKARAFSSFHRRRVNVDASDVCLSKTPPRVCGGCVRAKRDPARPSFLS